MELIHNFVSAHNVAIAAGLLALAYIFILKGEYERN